MNAQTPSSTVIANSNYPPSYPLFIGYLTCCHIPCYTPSNVATYGSTNDDRRSTDITQVARLVAAYKETAQVQSHVSLRGPHESKHQNRGVYRTDSTIGVYDASDGGSKAPQNAIRSISTADKTLLIDPIPSIFMSIVPCHTGKVKSSVDAGGSEVLSSMDNPRFTIGSTITWLYDFYPDVDSNTETAYGVEVHATGVIVKMTNFYVWVENIQLDKEGHSGKRERLDKPYLADRVKWLGDKKLASIIRNSIKKQPSQDITTPYTLYTLSDPRDERVHYVGISKDVERRYQEHVTCLGMNLHKNIWVIELFREERKPVLTIIEEITGKKQALERENYWIQHYLAQGSPLTNILSGEVEE